MLLAGAVELKSERASSAMMILFMSSQTECREKCSRKKSVQTAWLQIKSKRMAPEAELLPRCRRGEAGAWDELFDRHYAAAERFIFQLAPDFSRAAKWQRHPCRGCGRFGLRRFTATANCGQRRRTGSGTGSGDATRFDR
jgi:hypothetical protein